MIIVGITGSIATGKTTLAKIFAHRGLKIFNADKAVHHLINHQAKPALLKTFPQIADNTNKQNIDRKKLADCVFSNHDDFNRLEEILHPLVRQQMLKFIKQAQLNRCKMVILDVPLLFENGLHRLCDYVIVADVPLYIQKKRLQSLRKLSLQRQQVIATRQLSLMEKRKYADILIPMNNHYVYLARKIINVRQKIRLI